MSDRTAASIRIGGKLTPKQMDELVELALDETDGLSYGGCSTEEELREATRQASQTEGELNLFSDEAVGGAFPDLEQWLRQAGMSYRRHNSPNYWCDAMLVHYDGPSQRLLASQSDQEESELLDILVLKTVLESPDPVATVQGWYDQCKLPPLPPIKLVEEASDV